MLSCRYGCNRKFQSLADMKKHKDAYHAISMQSMNSNHANMMKCRYGCNRSFQNLEDMNNHRVAFHGSGSGGAPIASRPSAGTVPPRSTNKPPSTNKRKVTACNDCSKIFSSVDALRHHQMTQTNHIRLAREVGSFACEACSRTLRSQDSLEQHFSAEHSLILLDKGDNLRTKLEGEFKENWRKPSSSGRVLSVYKIYNQCWRFLGFEQYRATLQNSGNEVERYHGTSLLCDLGKGKKDSKLCQLEGCNLCSILRSGFKTAKARTGWQRFGKGIYTTATSGKSNDYIRSSSTRRAVLVCRVLAGKVFRTQTNMPDLEAPPTGYNSVSGEVGIHLNYDETVVYSPKAILPKYMIVYEL